MVSNSESFQIVKQLLDIFTNENNNYSKQQLDKLKKIISDIDYTSNLFSKLLNLIDECEKRGESIHKQNDFVIQLKKFKNLIEDSINKSTQNNGILNIINDFVSAIGKDYKIIRDYLQTLDDINLKIDKKLTKLTYRSDVALLLKRGVDKIPNQITKSDHKLDIVRTFCANFIEHAALLRELETDFNDTRYRLSLENIQTKLLNNEPNDVQEYFTKLQLKIVQDRGYSTEILFEHLAKNEVMIRSITNDSLYYKPLMLKIAESFLRRSTEQKLIGTLTNLVYHLNETSFKDLIKEIFKNDKLIELIFKAIYNKGIQLFSQAEPNFEPTKRKNLSKLNRKFVNLFTNESEIRGNEHSLLNVLRDQIIDETNAVGTKLLLDSIYGERIKSLDFSDDVTNVKYCFNSYFFKTLSYSYMDDISDLSLFSQIVFYAFACDTKQEPLSKLKVDQHKLDLVELNDYFKQRKYNESQLNDLIEILKMMINLESFQFRIKCIKSVLNNSDEMISTKVTLLKLFLDQTTNSKDIYLRLAQSFNIHLLNEAVEDKSVLIANLSKSNPNFKLYISKLNQLEKEFNVEQDLIAGFSIPYYLSAKLAEDDPNVTSDETIMCILFKVFTCSFDHDKEEFLKNKTNLNKEFKKLSESVSRLIKFYQDNSRAHSNDIIDTLKDKCLSYILEGFSVSNQESLSERNEYARLIIDNFIRYKFEHIIEVIKANKTSGETEILTVFDFVLKRKEFDNLSDWTEQTDKLGDKTFFLYCYYKYSETEFDKWFKELNPNASNSNYNIIQSKRSLIKKEFLTNTDAFNLINIKYLQHNQVGALSLIYDYIEDEAKSRTSNLFVKVGTGQGKSLIIAETAKKIIIKNRELSRAKQQIFVITCYDHLAKRDYENYQKYFKCFDINSVYCSSSTCTKDFSDKDVIYADLETLFNVLRKDGYNSIIESTSIQIPNYENSVLIMDEFDSLILDSDEIYQTVGYFKLKAGVTLKDFTNEKEVCSLLDKEFIDHFKDKFPRMFQDWWSSVQQKGIDLAAKTNQDSLGKESTFSRSFLTNLSVESRANLVYFYLDALVFYSKFKQAIGFSGSVNESGMNKFKTLFESKSTIYFEIPPFFGLQKLKMNRVNLKSKVIENRDDFLKEIETDIRFVCKEQPILIFADSLVNKNELKSDYDLISEKLTEAKEKFLKEFTIIYIRTEADINRNIHKIGKLGSITLATRIIGRGADIKVDKNIPKGLHLLLTYYPKRENIYIQMLGRTARQDEKGSFSEVVRFEKNFTDVNEVKIGATAKLAHNLNEYFYKKVSLTTKNIGIKWALFTEFVRYASSDYNEKELQNFIDKFIL